MKEIAGNKHFKEDLKEGFVRIAKKYTGQPIPPEVAAKMIEALLEQPWVKKLLVYSATAFLIMEWPTMQYRYVSPSSINVVGIEPHEFKDVSSIARLLTPHETKIAHEVANTSMNTLLRYKGLENTNWRFSRNAWLLVNGKMANILQHSIPLATSDQGAPLLEFIIFIDITSFNNSPNHFYKLSLANMDGSEEILLQGVFEKDIITPREREIFSLLILGRTSEEIAGQLNISSETVKTHRKHLLEKTKSENSIDLLRYGYAQGWL